ncbi:unnamed protein product [Lymnaea stagnalis]|uniref:Rad60/SUMO-like domain-containing protein n=1 Tax=Lymnaea stagnalis TaxID=6523 RepID=A0AAV2H194_LYMST
MSRALKALDQVRARLEQTATPQRKSHRADSDVELLYEENKTRVQVKVRYLLAVHRIEMKASEPFHALTTKLAEVTGQDEKTLTLYLRDCCLGLSESPLSVNLTVADIIECHCMKPEADQVASSNHINLVIRSVAAKTRTTLSANIRNPMKEVMDKYAAMNNLNSSTLVFTFDGDELYPLDTPLKLDLEDGDCIDV